MMSPSNGGNRQPGSRLFDTSANPDTPEYWEELSTRIQRRATTHGVSTWIARSRASWISVASLAVAAALVLLLSNRFAPARQPTAGAVLALAPTDGVGRTISSSERPPVFAELLFLTAGDTERVK
jgi:hypothetical protein